MLIMIKQRPILVALAFALCSLPACEKACQKGAQEGAENTVKQEEAAASVNNSYVSKAELDALHKRAVEKFTRTNRPVSAELDKKMRASILRKMIDDEIIKQKAAEEGVKVDRFERVEGLERYKDRMGGPKAFALFMEHQGLTEQQVEQTVLSDLQRDKLIEKLGSLGEPTDKEIEEYYQASQKLFSVPEMVRARHILLKLSEQDPKEKADVVLKKAQEILKEAQAGTVPFETLVHKYSEGPSAEKGGDLGFFARGRMTKVFEDAAFDAPVKKPVGPIKTEFGYHIIFVEEKTPAKIASLDEVKNRVIDAIRRNKRALKSEEILATLRQKSDVKIFDSALTTEEYTQAGKLGSKVAQEQGQAQEPSNN